MYVDSIIGVSYLCGVEDYMRVAGERCEGLLGRAAMANELREKGRRLESMMIDSPHHSFSFQWTPSMEEWMSSKGWFRVRRCILLSGNFDLSLRTCLRKSQG